MQDINCVIDLDKFTVSTEETITGTVQYDFPTETRIQSIFVVFSCREIKSKIQYNKSREEYKKSTIFSKNFTLLQDNQTNTLTRITSGNHIFPINFTIPLESPSSFLIEDFKGYLAYEVVYMIEVFRKTNEEIYCDAEININVIKPIYLNLFPNINVPLPIENEMRKYLWYCFPKGIVKITGNLQKHGYKAGSNIEIILKCINDTSYRINSLIISLTIETLCILNEKSDLYKKIANIEMSYLKIGAIQAYEKRKFQRMLLIPPIQPWSSDGCEMFKIIYYLKIKVIFPVPLKSLKMKIPIIIGSHLSQTEDDNTSSLLTGPLLVLNNIGKADSFKFNNMLSEWNNEGHNETNNS